jgi:hypothetical protein
MEKPVVFDEWVGEALAFAEMTCEDVDWVIEDVRRLKYEATLREEEGVEQRAWKRLEMALTAIKPILRKG